MVQDLLLSRYSNIDYVLSLPIEEGLNLIQYAIKKRSEECIFKRWIAGYQEVMSFENFKTELGYSMSKMDNRSAENILEKVKKILSKGRCE